MRRITSVLVVGLMAVAACSSGSDTEPTGDAGSLADEAADADDVTQLCSRWADYEALMESDAEPSDELVAELLEREDGIEEVLPADLESAWDDITGWTAAFIEYFSIAGYQAVGEDTVTLVFGTEDAAQDAADSMEDGFAAMNAWSALNCTIGAGDAASFCRAWTDIAALLTVLDDEPPTAQRVDELFARYDEAAAVVPAEIRADWNALLEHAIPMRDVLITVEYDLDRVSDDLLVEAFGSIQEFDALERAAAAGRDAIDAWSLDGCGDFCTRWGQTREAIEMLRNDLSWVVDRGDEGRSQLQTMLARLEIADQQLPEELRAEWDLLMVVLDDWLGWWEELEYDGARTFGPDGFQPEGLESALAIARDATYLADLLPEVWRVPERDREQFTVELLRDEELAGGWVDAVGYVGSSTVERIDAWVDEHCDTEGGLPGRVKVTFPEIEGAAGSTIVLAVMPAGSAVDDLGDVDARAAGWCGGVGSDPWGYELDGEGRRQLWESEWFQAGTPEDWGPDSPATLCDFDWAAGPAVLQPGPYSLLVVVVPGGVMGRTLPAPPTTCAALDIAVDGDTNVPLPELETCDADLGDLVADGTWASSDRIDPATPGAGTLRVIVPGLTLPEEFEDARDGELQIVVLPAGTTLNEVGREQVWPGGGYQAYLEPPENRGLVGLGAVAVPIMAMPPNGAFGWFDPWWLAEADDDELPLVVLAPGEYDLLVEIFAHPEGDWDARERRCGRTTVTIDGDTVIEMPELGDCP
jgi:hypothetical protein